MDKKIIKLFGKSKKGNFEAIDTIGIPHPYCITPKHLIEGDMYLNVEKAEKENNAVCDICKKLVNSGKQDKILTYEEHKQAIVIKCNIKANKSKELHNFLLSIKKKVEKKGYAGFVLMDNFSKKGRKV